MSTLILPFSLWSVSEQERSSALAYLKPLHAPHWQAWLVGAAQQTVNWLPRPSDWHPDGFRLISMHEWALAYAQGWLTVGQKTGQMLDGLLPMAAKAAAEKKLSAPADHGWAKLSWCHWSVNNGQAILLQPQDLKIDAALDAQLFELMQPFFWEAGVHLYRDLPGHWLAHAREFKHLPTASLERMLHRNIDAWLISGPVDSDQTKAIKRLQNEVQMLLYTHAINDDRELSINSFWLHATGDEVPLSESQDVQVWDDLRASALQQDWAQWMATWSQLDERLAHMTTPVQRLILCGEDELCVFEKTPLNPWQRIKQSLGLPLGAKDWSAVLLPTQREI